METKFENFNEEKKTYYNSHGESMPFTEFIEIEVEERENYEMEEVDEWIELYDIDIDSECIWVTKDKRNVYKYILTADYWDAIDNGDNIDNMLIKEFGSSDDTIIYEYKSDEGTLIEETDDGDGGFLFVFNK